MDHGRARQHASFRLTSEDFELLGFLAEHRLVLASQARSLLGITDKAANARLRALRRAGYVAYEDVFGGQPAICQIRPAGLAAIGSELPAPRFKLAGYRHDVGLAWLWLMARNGKLGPVREVLGERQLRSRDGAMDRSEEPYAVRLGGVGPHGHERLHYPDLLLVTRAGARVGVELELSSKGRARRETILGGYASDRRIDAVIYLVEDRPGGRAIGRSIETSARRLGVSSLVHVRRVRWSSPMPGDSLGSGAVRSARSEAGRSGSTRSGSARSGSAGSGAGTGRDRTGSGRGEAGRGHDAELTR